jgi:integrase
MKHTFPGLLKDKTASGKVRWRVRVERSDRKMQIPCGPGEPGFHEHYHAARAGEKIETVKQKVVKAGTLDQLCEKYLENLEAKVAAESSSSLTLKGHRHLLGKACEVRDPNGNRAGVLDAELPEEAFTAIQDSFGAKTGAADNCVKALRAAYRWGSKRGFPKSSPVFHVEKVHTNRGGATPWTVTDMRKFLAHHGPGTTARLWFLLSLNTLPRISDVFTLGPDNLTSIDAIPTLSFQPTKKGSAKVAVPALAQLLEELERHTPRQTFIATKTGAPFASSEAMRNRIQDWTRQAGLPAGRTQHGVRKGAAHLLAAAGATQFEIMCLMSHTEAKTSEIYTKDVERAQMSARAIAHLSNLNLDHAPKIVVQSE